MIQDCEYDGTCTMCGKEGVRWIVVMSDGSRVGGECAKKLLGWKPTAKNFSWVTGMKPAFNVFVLGYGNVVVWKSKNQVTGAISVNGHPMMFGSIEFIAAQYNKIYAPYVRPAVIPAAS